MSLEPLMTVTQLLRKWDVLKKETGNKPIEISARTLYRLIADGKIRVHGFGSPLVYESEVIEDFKNSRYTKLKVIDGNPHMGHEKKKVEAELDRRLQEAALKAS